MLKCKSCIHKRDISGNSHVSCNKGATVVSNVNIEAAQKGWFMWPVNFDPIWAKDCIGYVDVNDKLEEKTREELETIFGQEMNWFKVMLDEKFQYVHPMNVQKVENNFKKFQETLSSLDEDTDKWSNEDFIKIINSIRNI